MPADPIRARDVFLDAVELPLDRRPEYLAGACAGDLDLRAEVDRLLAANVAPDSILEPASPPPSEATGAFVLGDPGIAATEATEVASTDPGTGTSAPPVVDVTEAVGSASPPPRADGAAADGRVGTVIAGRYSLVERIGEGGMGSVYRASQAEPIRRQVALKLIRAGMDSRTVLARFDAERQALALMDHPNIARVFDGGATESGQPFFVMEFVRGVPITDYCDRHKLSVDARLELFVAVCQAVQHAHQKGIIHRDLKPSNVLVTEVDGRPTPKVIDFGVAKATGFDLTDRSLGDTDAIVGTPTYMSPEQADPSSMDIDTRTDIYALGVILYELLAGSTPLDATRFRRGALLEMLRMVREVEPSKPSTKVSTADALPNIAANRGIDPDRLKRELRGDLDWIVMKALEKDRTRRYETANGFAADILRHLASEPVLAAPPSRSYRLRKFVRKHRAGVIAASLVFLALLAGVTGTTWGLFEARRSAEAERLARLDAQEKKALAEANEQKALAAAEGERLAKQQALAAAEEEKKAKETAEDVLGFVEKRIFAAARPKGQVGGLGYDVKLADAIAAALSSIEDGFKDKPLTEARLRSSIGHSFVYLGNPDLAVRQYELTRSIYSRHLGTDHPSTINSMNDLAVSYEQLGRHAEALKLREEALALAKARFGPDHPSTLRSMSNLANSYDALGRHAEALKLREEVLALRKAIGLDHPETLASMDTLALSYFALGRHAEALKLGEEVLALKKAKLGPDHPNTLISMGNLANSDQQLGRHAEALKLGEEVLALRKAKLGPDHPHTLASMSDLALSYFALGRQAEALKLREEVLALRKAKLGPDHPHTLISMGNLAISYAELGRHAEALKLREETVALRKAIGPDHPSTLISMVNLAISYAELGRQAEALKLGEEVLPLMKAKLGPDHPHTLISMGNLATSYEQLGRHAETLKLREEAPALAKARFGPDHPSTLRSLQELAISYHRLGRRAEALKLREEVLALRKAKLAPDHPETLGIMADLAISYLAEGRRGEALSLLECAAGKDTEGFLTLAAVQAWFGEGEAYAATRQRFLAFAREAKTPVMARRATLAGALQPSADPATLEAVLALGRRAAELGKGERDLLALGMAESRNGHFAEADVALLGVPKAGEDAVPRQIAAFYRAMNFFRQGKRDEARDLATRTAREMTPPPQDEQKPFMIDGSDTLILWLACKEAKALIGFDPPPAAPARPEGK